MDAEELLAHVYELAPTKDPAAALALGADQWDAMSTRPANPEDAETCRLLAISGAETGEYSVADRWRDRARALGEKVGWPELIAALDMSEAFKALSIRNGDYHRGKTLDVIDGSPEAVELISTLSRVANGPESGIRVSDRSPSVALIRRFVLEKTGSFQLALGQWDLAAVSFAQAVKFAESPRGLLKSRGGLALAVYSRAMDTPNDDSDSLATALAETRSIADEAGTMGEDDVASTAGHNANVMARSGRDLLLYEIL
jgi:hypothetical protein